MKKGTLIVIDGSDGSGKTTQVKRILNRLRKEGKKVRTVDFPMYYKIFFGRFIGECLRDKKYNFLATHAKIASVLYAVDRWETKEKIEKWLSDGCIVIANRYVSSNQIHQAGKLKNIRERREFLKWLDTMEYGVFGLPRPTLVLYLSVPVKLLQELIKHRDKLQQRKYLRKKKDVHESSLSFLENSRKSALKLVGELNNFVKIECSSSGVLYSKKIIHEKVYSEIIKVLK